MPDMLKEEAGRERVGQSKRSGVVCLEASPDSGGIQANGCERLLTRGKRAATNRQRGQLVKYPRVDYW